MKSARDFFEQEGLTKEKINEIIEEVDNEIIKIEYDAAINAVMINGIEQVLEFAKKKNLKQAIFTFNTRKNAEIRVSTRTSPSSFSISNSIYINARYSECGRRFRWRSSEVSGASSCRI